MMIIMTCVNLFYKHENNNNKPFIEALWWVFTALGFRV